MNSESNDAKFTESQLLFKNASDEVKELIRRILKSERQVQHMKRRSDIVETILEHVKTVIRK